MPRGYRRSMDMMCGGCGEEFSVRVGTKVSVCFCPFCGDDAVGSMDEVPMDDEFDDFDEEEEDDDFYDD